MKTSNLKEEIEKMKSLIALQKRLAEDANQGDSSEILKRKVILTREEILKSTYKINKLIKEIEKGL